MVNQFQSWTRKVYAILGVILFIGFLWAPVIGLATGTQIYKSSGEMRAMARFPGLPKSLDDLETWRSKYEAFINDHFGFRNALVRLHNGLSFHLLNKPGAGRVILGKDGWLFLEADSSLKNFRRTLAPWSRSEMRSLVKRIQQRQDFLASKGVEYLFVVVPAKSTIYPEHYDERWQRLERPSRLEQFRDFTKSYPKLHYLDLTAALLKEKSRLAAAEPDTRLYYKTDTHWNSRGASVAAARIRRELNKFGAQVPEPRRWPSSAWQPKKSELSGDLARLLGAGGTIPNVSWHLGTASPLRSSSLTALPYERRSYLIVDPKPSCETTLLVLHDSFGEALREFLSKGHPRSAFVWEPLCDIMRMAEFTPQVIIREITERFFITWPQPNPVELRKIKDSPTLSEQTKHCLAETRLIKVGDSLLLHGIDLLDHGDNLELVLFLEAQKRFPLLGSLHARITDAKGDLVVNKSEVLCPLHSTAQPGFRWQHSFLLDAQSYERTARISLMFPRQKQGHEPLYRGEKAIGGALLLQRSQARRSRYFGK
ncbi:MAG: hypothetical protein CSA62_05560 [Planctomycetota bacterium]|nr:MAG: hypothetical protein CSA62_05560 [Planctomycetota bacterium]